MKQNEIRFELQEIIDYAAAIRTEKEKNAEKQWQKWLEIADIFGVDSTQADAAKDVWIRCATEAKEAELWHKFILENFKNLAKILSKYRL